jgi:cytochrome c oxidase assembly protein subunit 15
VFEQALNRPSSLRVLSSHLVVALVALVVIGGATRVMEAGLACPDWPLCYGVFLPGRQMNLQVFLEWFHRLDAFLVGVTLLVLLVASFWHRQQLPSWMPWTTLLAVALVAVQGALGALTVTQLLASSTVTAHLATALLLVGVVSGIDQGLVQASNPIQPPPTPPSLASARCLIPVTATALVFAQCVLGGLMASQWAVDHCFQSGNQCEWLMRHRQLAQPAALAVGVLALSTALSPSSDSQSRTLSFGAAGLVGLQVLLGILTLRWQLGQPLLTIGHQLVAALLMACLGALCGRAFLASHPQSMSPSLEVTCG